MIGYGISIGVSPREPLENVGRLAADIEAGGFDALWIIDFQIGMKDVYQALALAALSTKRIQLGPGVTNLATRHSTVTANAITGIDELSNGRAVLGLGAGWSAVHATGQAPSRLPEIREGMKQFRALFSGEECEIDGARVKLATARRQIPIYLAAAQPGMLRLAGESADGVILMGAADVEFCNWQLQYLREGLERSGRSRKDICVDMQVMLSIDEDEKKAVDDVRAWATSQAASWVDWKQMPPSYEAYRDQFRRAAENYNLVEHLSLHAQHKGILTDDFVTRVAIAGNEETCVRRLRELSALDIDRISFPLLSGGRMRRLKQFSESVIPTLTSA